MGRYQSKENRALKALTLLNPQILQHGGAWATPPPEAENGERGFWNAGGGAVSATLLATWPGLGEQGESCAPLQEDASILTGCLTTFTFKVLKQ